MAFASLTALAACSKPGEPSAGSKAAPSLASSVKAPAAEEPLSLEILNIRAERYHDDKGIMFHVDVRVINPGAQRNMLTNFSTIVDGFWIIVTDSEGVEIRREGYSAHQSPFAQDRPLPIAAGSTEIKMAFPLDHWTSKATTVQVRLEGGFYGTPWPHGIVTNTLPVTLP